MSTVLLLGFSPDTFSEEQLESIRQLAGDRTLLQTQDRDEIAEVIDRVEIVAGSLPTDLLPRASSLRWYQQWGAGADWLFENPAAQEMDFVLTNASGVHGIPISEHIFALLLAFARDLPRAMRAQAQHHWVANQKQRFSLTGNHNTDPTLFQRSRYDLFELAHKTIAIVGMGAIGARTAKVAAALEMHPVGIRRDPSQSVPGVETMVAPDDMLSILPDVDFLVNTTPLTPETRGMFDARVFAAMRNTAYFINIGRGGSAVESDLVHALQNGEIAGAGLDVFEEEPLPPASPLWDMDNVIITSHYSGLTPQYDERALEIFLENLQRYQQGEPLRNVVDKSLGY